MKMDIPTFNDIDAWRHWAGRVASDLEALNEQLNEAAEERDLCSEYEDCLDSFNRPTRTFEMEGRVRRYLVDATISVYVNARDAAAAEVLANVASAVLVSGAADDLVRERDADCKRAGYEASTDYHIGSAEEVGG